MRSFSGLKIFLFVLLCAIPSATSEEAGLPFVVLEGENGGTAAGEEWDSRQLIGKTNLIL